LPQSIPFESSRGCWWAENCHCTFCGFNTSHIKYRKKTKEKIINEIIHLKNKYGVKVLMATDNIMPRNFGGVIQELIKLDQKVLFYYEIRSNLQPTFLDDLVRAGIVVLQVGVESLATPILKKMRKGVNGLQNIRLLRDTRSRGIYVAWNFLLWIPGETPEDYRELVEIVPALEHLQAPYFWGPVTIDRYSPYFNHPQEFGIRNVRPWQEYSLIYPPGTDLDNLVYHFIGDYESCFSANPELFSELNNKIDSWVQQWDNPSKAPHLSRLSVTDGMALIKDTRSVAVQAYTVLDDRTTALLETLAEPQPFENIPAGRRDYLGELLERKFVLFFEGHYISLVTDALLASPLLTGTGTAAGGGLSPALNRNMGILRNLSGEGILPGEDD
jgi:ribosomal peptide maturation radical SAM protein 1